MSGLIPGRECGGCTVCCTSLVIDTPEFKKISGIPCQHLGEQGCGIHETRYPVCRQWFCAWRRAAFLDDWWRPDRSGVLVYVTDTHIPSHFPRRTGLIFKIVGDPAVISDDRFIWQIADLIHGGTAVFLAVSGPPGHESSRTFLNDEMAASGRSPPTVHIRQSVARAAAMASSARTMASRYATSMQRSLLGAG